MSTPNDVLPNVTEKDGFENMLRRFVVITLLTLLSMGVLGLLLGVCVTKNSVVFGRSWCENFR
jgi:hypothetical protein